MKISEIILEYKKTEQNPQLKGHQGAYDYLMHLSPDQLANIGVTMTELPYPKINTRYKSTGPTGIYFYPASYYVNRKRLNHGLPYADTRPYINIFSWNTTKVLDLGKINKQSLQQELQKLSTVYGEDRVKFAYDRVDDDRNSVDPENSVAGSYNDGGLLWDITRILAGSKKTTWNSILRKVLGYDVIVDDTGAIFWEEPTQGVLLNPSIMKHLNVFSRSINKQAQLTNLSPRYIVDRKIPFFQLPPAAQHALLHDREYSMQYAKKVIKGPWPALENMLIQSGEWMDALDYLQLVRKAPWPALEQLLTRINEPDGLRWYHKLISGSTT